MVHSNRSCTLQAVKRRTDPLLLFLFLYIHRFCGSVRLGAFVSVAEGGSVGKWGFAQCYGGRCCESVAIYYI